MTDITKFKSVGIEISSYDKLKTICDYEDRNIRQQLTRLINIKHKELFGEQPAETFKTGGIINHMK